MNDLPILCLAGPTASGKSASTHILAQHWPIEVIVMDSATIYRDMDIGTAKPSAEEQAAIPHHLLDIRDPAESYSAAEFATDATRLIQEIRARGHYPVLCGGTMLYYKALREGLNDLPQADPAIRQQLDERAQEIGWPGMHEELTRIDPVTAARLAPRDSQRIQRALEIFHISGKTMSDWLKDKAQPQEGSHQYVTMSLEPEDRSWLHKRIAVRYHDMIEQGLLQEVEKLYQRPDLHPGLPSIRCVGYRQLWSYLDGEVSLDLAIEQAIAATRQLAKRQLTWLRSEPERQQFNCQNPQAAEQIVQAARQIWPA
ncbi:tRNA (adenosine(37)-N6)-dimethylallyltransferase MiaA [Alcaligenes faecalis]|jgi:tRNA dimethylallyltransferase|uniref:tRNA dimethylallyltransferase n=1 Tax=Alcaligenes faecalis TaxID=511 RepID=A0A2U2BKK6_ALCFA|nr:tRNA (adenosine(37)-N6)-dimethylallyltransferase MiaA [Alcaligenes faecalis]ARP52732.1 tRNA delta-isopentenylpyrophosphate transferase [Alcaligenes faecalis]KAA1285500.1 tRNA (adenosine(37)-N6)-dimethylallyltransferase MiaA [Alcaligenes faecalis]MBW4788445.1 tRNA (adenosine(37)-N6)-dimethylallyltransferase MiaA [Alcaligenes faecalis subsp. faecalis]OSZ34736.1 tRNA (adenosine(37)-N6)-dimethylallyltransferase MiaA [Alcaligenes faecalis]OSZ42902.1 tRNA (adenosine(37)-N6)-dimethylallyltransfera